MIDALRQAFELAEQKSEEEQAAIAELILEELRDEEHWNELLSHPKSATLLDQMAAQALEEYEAGLTFIHDTIKSNMQRILWNLLRGKQCRVYSSDLKVAISKERYFHPDVTVTCDPCDRGTGDLLQSPRVVVEVLSPSTELKDRTWKLQNYTSHPTIEEYMLVSSRSLKIELYRKEQNKWVYYSFGTDEDIELSCLGVHFSLTEAYEDINPEEDFSSGGENEIFP